MSVGHELPTILHRIDRRAAAPALAVLATTVEILSIAPSGDDGICVLRGVVPPGVSVPLHRHDDPEDFLILAGAQQVLIEGANGLEWVQARAGDYIRIPSGTMHAHRNASSEPAVDLVVTTVKLGRFLEEVGRPVTATLPPPSPHDIERFVAAALRYGYVLGTPEENAAVGIELPGLASS